MLMELRQLRYFVKTAGTLSFSEAAKVLNIAQSTLSQQIRQLEDELHIQLFERHAHSISLTEAAAEVLPLAIRTIHDADSCVSKIQDINRLETGSLNIGVTYSFSPILTETLIGFTKRFPKIKLNVMYEPMSELMDMLRRRAVDFVLAFKPNSVIPDIESHTLFENHLAVVVNQSHPLSARSKLSLADLSGFHIALPSKGLQARNALDINLSPLGCELDVRVELNEVNILLELVRHSSMVTILAEAAVYGQHGVKAIPIELPVCEMAGCVHMLKDSYRKHSAIKFIEMLRESDAVMARTHNWFL